MGVIGNYTYNYVQKFIILFIFLIIAIQIIALKSDVFQATDNFSHVISGGRDKRVVMTELSYAERYTVICEEKAPILKMAMTPDQSSIWVATSESTINNWVNKVS